MKAVIDGNIGVGKSTQLRLLESRGFRVHTEPVSEWPLDLFYTDRPRWAFMLQMHILLSFENPKECLYERCPGTSNFVFWKNLFDSKLVTELENAIYQVYYQKVAWKPDVYIWLHQPAEMCLDRIKARRQAGDSGINLDYLQDLDYYYEKFWEKLDCPYKVCISVAHKTELEIHTEILSHLRAYELLESDTPRKKVPKDCSYGWKMLRTYLSDLLYMS